MKTFIQNINYSLQKKLHEIEMNESNILDIASASIFLLENTFEELKAFVVHYTFKSKEEEIHFFKKVKTSFILQTNILQEDLQYRNIPPRREQYGDKEIIWLKNLTRFSTILRKI